MVAIRALVFGAGSAAAVAVYVYARGKCPCIVELINNWDALLMVAATAGLGKFLHSGRSKK